MGFGKSAFYHRQRHLLSTQRRETGIREFEILDQALLQGIPELLSEIEPDREIDDVGKLTGLQFLYTAHGLSSSLEAQDRLIELVDGRGLRAAGSLRRRKMA